MVTPEDSHNADTQPCRVTSRQAGGFQEQFRLHNTQLVQQLQKAKRPNKHVAATTNKKTRELLQTLDILSHPKTA